MAAAAVSASTPAIRSASDRIAVEEVACVDWNRNAPRDETARHDDDPDVEPDDVADAEQRGRQIRADVSDTFADIRCRGGGIGNEPRATAREKLQHAAENRGTGQELHARPRVVTRLEDLGCALAFGKREVLLDDQSAAQRHGK
jgi:hypothetical protein